MLRRGQNELKVRGTNKETEKKFFTSASVGMEHKGESEGTLPQQVYKWI